VSDVDLPGWEPGTVVVLSTAGAAPHAIPVSAALRDGPRGILLALARRRQSLARLRAEPRVAVTVMARASAFTAHGAATVVEEALAEAANVAAVRVVVDRVQDHLTPAFEIHAGVGWAWVDDAARERDRAVRDGLLRLSERG